MRPSVIRNSNSHNCVALVHVRCRTMSCRSSVTSFHSLTHSLTHTHTHTLTHTHTHTHTHTTFNGPFPGLPRWASTRKVKPIWILLKQETVSGSGIRWAIWTSAPRSRQITTPAPHHCSFLQAGCPSCRPTNSVKALKALQILLQ